MNINFPLLILLLNGIILSSCSIFNNKNNTSTAEANKLTNFIEAVKKNDQKKLSSLVKYPLNREYPLPNINDSQAFLSNYNTLFDDQLRKIISSSNPETDWDTVGWRGIMLKSGILWLDYDGLLLALNYQSEAEKQKRQELIAQQKQSIHPSLKDFDVPILELETENTLVRIDDLGDYNYRYTSWPRNTKMSEIPDIVITNGDFVPDGSGGNHRYVFTKGINRYECAIIVLGASDSPPARLVIYKEDKEVSGEAALILRD